MLCKATPNTPWPYPGRFTQKISHEEMMADFDGEDIDDRFRRLLTKANPVKWGFFHHWRTASYYKGRICLLGDSAHASLPFQAAGAAQGVEDALVLSNVLEELAKGSHTADDVQAGLKAYDAIRRPRAQKQLELAHEVSTWIYFQDEESGEDMEKILPKLQKDRFDWLWFHDLQGDVDRAVSMMKENLPK